ncbi:glutathionylspermidine synthase family protein [Brevibacillus daliensis]|uniref:glutathionylspermidine synthase family protein n=1 Tax=Brevibacillus daliensis TaxID=2892995 RepID=UPI001E3DBB82|nr:glutathionylspermidine synthase family protein [Brevibacillus daliensis]
MTHKDARAAFYQQIPDYWADLYGQEYSLFDIHLIHKEEVDAIRKATERAGKIFFKMAKLLREVDDSLLEGLGFPASSIKYVRHHPMPMESVIARLDLVKAGEHFVVLEINSDTPTFIKELFHVNGQICHHFGVVNPNAKEEIRLRKAVTYAIEHARKSLHKEQVRLVYSAHGDHSEDRFTLEYLRTLTGLPAEFIPLEELRIRENEGLFDQAGNQIDILYRQTYPIENMLQDFDPETKEHVGEMLLDLVIQNKLAIVNPLSAFLLQSKAVQAIIWGLHEEKHPYFTEEEHGWISKHFLPTYLEAEPFIEKKQAFVKKPAFGREGDTVEIYEKGRVILEDKNKSYVNYLPVYQQFVPLPKTTYKTELGEKVGHMMVGSFLINESPSAIGYRVGGQITDNLSYFLPCGHSGSK